MEAIEELEQKIAEMEAQEDKLQKALLEMAGVEYADIPVYITQYRRAVLRIPVPLTSVEYRMFEEALADLVKAMRPALTQEASDA